MVRTQVQLRDQQLEGLKARAASEQVSVSELVRRAVDLLTQIESLTSSEEKRRRAMAVAGRFSSGVSDVAENHDNYLAEAFRPPKSPGRRRIPPRDAKEVRVRGESPAATPESDERRIRRAAAA